MNGGSDLRSPSDDAFLVVQTAWRLAEQRQPEQGLKLLEDLLNRDPACADAWLVAGNIFQHYGEFGQAADAYRHVLALATEHSGAVGDLQSNDEAVACARRYHGRRFYPSPASASAK